MSPIEKLFFYGVLIYFLFGIVVPITIFYWFNKGKKELTEYTKVEKKINRMHLDENPDYNKVKHLFNQSIKSGKLKRSQLLQFKDFINRLLDRNITYYSKFVFKNDCHEIYIKLKDSNFTKLEYIQMYQYLNRLID